MTFLPKNPCFHDSASLALDRLEHSSLALLQAASSRKRRGQPTRMLTTRARANSSEKSSFHYLASAWRFTALVSFSWTLLNVSYLYCSTIGDPSRHRAPQLERCRTRVCCFLSRPLPRLSTAVCELRASVSGSMQDFKVVLNSRRDSAKVECHMGPSFSSATQNVAHLAPHLIEILLHYHAHLIGGCVFYDTCSQCTTKMNV